jgi:hypothetical protein
MKKWISKIVILCILLCIMTAIPFAVVSQEADKGTNQLTEKSDSVNENVYGAGTVIDEVYGLNLLAADSPPVTVSYADAVNWAGRYPMTGDKEFYIEVLGTGFLEYGDSLEAEVFILDGSDYVKVATQKEWRYLGKTARGEEHFIFQMEMDGNRELSNTEDYYIDIKDQDDNYLFPDRSIGRFGTINAASGYIKNLSVSKISSAVNNLSIAFDAYGLALELTKNDIDVELWQFTQMGWSGPMDDGTYLGTMSKENMLVDDIKVVDEINSAGYPIGSGYRIRGNIPLTEALKSGDKLYLKVTAERIDGEIDIIYSLPSDAIRVLNGQIPAAESLNIINGLGSGSRVEHEQGGGEPADPVYVIDNRANTLEFQFYTASITDAGKINAQLKDGNNVIGSLRPGSVEVQPNSHGIYIVKGVVDITGTVPDGADLLITYNNSPLTGAIIKRSNAVGVNTIWYGDSDHRSRKIFQPLDGKIELCLEGAFNIQESGIEANLIDESENKISLNVSPQRIKNGIILTLTPETELEGKYNLELLYDKKPLMSVYYAYDEQQVVESESPLLNEYNAMIFEFLNETVLKNIINDRGDLLIRGIDFDDTRSYEAKLIKRIGTALNSQPFGVTASYISRSELKIDKEDLESFPRGWYTVYLTEDGEQVKGFADVTLFSEGDGGPSIILPKGTINNNAAYTTEANVILNISPGSFQKVKFAESEAALEQAAWRDIVPEIPFTLSEGYGTKTIYFLFKADMGEEYSLTDSIIYRGTALESMIEYGVANSKVLEDGTVFLNKDRYYTFYIVSNQLNLTGKAEFYDEHDALIHTEELKRTASNKGVHTYAKTIKIDSKVENAVKVDFYVEDNEGFLSPAESKNLLVRNEAYILKAGTVFKTRYYHTTFIENDSQIQYTLTGIPNFIGGAKLTYVDTGEENKTIDYLLTFDENTNVYSHQAALPAGAKKIISVEYSLTDPENGENKATVVEEKNLEISGSISFVGLDNEGGDYNGKTITLFNNLDWFRQDQVIGENETDFKFNGLRPTGNYQYQLKDEVHVYASGKIDLSPGQNETVDLSSAYKPAKVRFNVTGGGASVRISYRIKDTNYYRYVESGEELNEFFVGQELEYGVVLSEPDAKKYKIPEEKTMVIAASNETININLEELPKIKVTGTISDERISGRNIDGCVISLYQSFRNGYRYISHNDTTVTDGEGRYEIEIYSDVPVYMYISKTGYLDDAVNFSSETDVEKNIGLEYSVKNKIAVDLFTRPLVDQGEEVDNTTLIGLDNTNISRVTVRKADGVTYVDAGYYWHSSTIHIYDRDIRAGEKLRLYFEFNDGLHPDEPFYEVTLDEYLNGKVNAVALPKGEVTAHVLTGGDNPPASYLLLYDESGQQAAVITGIDHLSSEFHNLKAGDYTAVIFKGYGLKKAQNLKLLETFEFLDLEENTHYVKKTLAIEKGKRTSLGDIELKELVLDEQLGFTENSIKTKYTPNNDTGEVAVVVSFKADFTDHEEEIILERINIISTAALKGNEVYYEGEKYSGSSFTPWDMSKTSGLMSFTLIPPATDQTTLNISLRYKIGNNYHNESFGVDNIDVPKVTIIPPKEVFLGEKARNILVRGIGLPESTIEIYDNDTLIGKTVIPADKTNYQTSVALTYPDYAMGHIMYAKMITKDGEIHTSSLNTCEIIDPQKAAYTSHFKFSNAGYEFSNDSPDESNHPLTLSYNPYAKTKVSFRINNLLKDQISYAGLVNKYNGVDTMFEATHVRDVVEGDTKYSEWELDKYLNVYLGDLSIYYALAYDEPLAPISGTKDIDFAEAINQPNIDPVSLSVVIRDNLDKREIQQDENNLNILFPVADGSSLHVTGSFTEGHTISEEELISQGYRKYETLQGYYWTKEELTENGDSAEYTRTMYFSPELTALLKGDTGAKRKASRATGMMNTDSTTNDVLSKADYAGYVYNLGDFVNDTSANPANLSRVGNGMQVLGGAVLAGQVIMGPTSKDHNTLYAEADKIENSLVKSRLYKEIMEYDRARRSAHKMNTLFSGVSYGAGFAGPIGKGLSYIVSSGGMIYGKKTGAELDLWWDAVMRDIQNELILQQKRKEQEEKPQPGKRDDQKHPNWKVDPSGYVYEVIDSNRVEGITASVLLKNELDDEFYFWNKAEEWGEINPDITDEEGKYGWDVPAGEWKVSFTGSGYQPSETKSMTVPPIHDQVNIGLLSTKAPQVRGTALDSSGLEVEFDMFMQGETIYDPDTLTENIVVTDSGNNQVPCKKIDFIIEADNDTYKSGGQYQLSVIDSDKFVKRIRFVPDTDLYPGGFKEYKDDGITPETYQVKVLTNVQSYAGVNLESDYQSPELELGLREKVAAPQPDVPAGIYSSVQEVAVTTETSGATIHYTTDGTTPTALSRIYLEPIVVTKNTVIKLLASKVGMDDSDVVTLSYTINPGMGKVAATPTANIPSGTYRGSQSVSLTTATAGATIYYTLDGSTPTKDSPVYVSPIRIDATKTLKAMAVKEGYANSGIAAFNYIIIKGGSPGGSSGGDRKKEVKDEVKEEVIEEIEEAEEVVPRTPTNPFNDISGYSWAEEAIISLAEQGIIKGVSSTNFAPHTNIKRADYIALMVRLFGMTADVQGNFSDVRPDKYYYQEVGIARELGLIEGIGDQQFNPEASITRQDMFVIADRILRALGFLDDEADVGILEQFSDYDQIAPYAKLPMARLVANGYILGDGRMLNPVNNTTRAETAVFIYRISKMLAKN